MASLPHPPIHQQVTFLYTRDLTAIARFYEEVLGLTLTPDQGDCRIYHVSRDGYLGFCQRQEAPDELAGVILPLVIPLCALAYQFFCQLAWITDCSWVTSTGTASDSPALTVSRSSVLTTCKVHIHGTGLLSTVMS
jgi:hypothetical protein